MLLLNIDGVMAVAKQLPAIYHSSCLSSDNLANSHCVAVLLHLCFDWEAGLIEAARRRRRQALAMQTLSQVIRCGANKLWAMRHGMMARPGKAIWKPAHLGIDSADRHEYHHDLRTNRNVLCFAIKLFLFH